jgi:hypothetical protein
MNSNEIRRHDRSLRRTFGFIVTFWRDKGAGFLFRMPNGTAPVVFFLDVNH